MANGSICSVLRSKSGVCKSRFLRGGYSPFRLATGVFARYIFSCFTALRRKQKMATRTIDDVKVLLKLVQLQDELLFRPEMQKEDHFELFKVSEAIDKKLRVALPKIIRALERKKEVRG